MIEDRRRRRVDAAGVRRDRRRAASRKLDLFAIADRLEARGWSVDRQHRPATIHLTVTANHAAIVDAYVADLRAAVDDVRANPKLARTGTAAMYGMAAKIPMRGMVAANIRQVMAGMYAPGVVVPDVTQAGGAGVVDKLVTRFAPQLESLLDTLAAARTRLRHPFRGRS